MHKLHKKFSKIIPALLISSMILTGCNGNTKIGNTQPNSQGSQTEQSGEGDQSSKTPLGGSDKTELPLDYDTLNIDTTLSLSEYDDGSGFINMSETKISLSDSEIKIDGAGASANAKALTISSEGIYRISGKLSDGTITINAKDAHVNIILDGADISSSTGSPINVEDAKKVLITLEKNTSNKINDNTPASSSDDSSDTSSTAAIFSKDDLTIGGQGELTIAGNSNGIVSKDKLKLLSGEYNIDVKNNAIRGKECVAIYDGTYNITAGNNGIKSYTDATDTAGFIKISGGTIKLSASDNGIHGEYLTEITGGTLDISTENKKAIKSDYNVSIEGGTITIDSKDDAINSAGDVNIKDGKLTINAKDDAIHADRSLTISGGEYQIESCYEGLEALYITLSGGEGVLHASDDGMNANGAERGFGGGRGPMGGDNGQNDANSQTTNDVTSLITISGGKHYIYADGDGVDSNGNINMTGGYVEVYGPTSNNNAALDYGGNFTMSGGTILAAGSSGMAQTVSPVNCYAVMINFNQTQTKGTKIKLKDSTSTEIISFSPQKNFTNIVICSPSLSAKEYSLHADDTTLCTFTIADASTKINSDGSQYSGGNGFGGGRGDKGDPNQRPGGDFNPGSNDMTPGERPDGQGNGQFPGNRGDMTEKPNRGNGEFNKGNRTNNQGGDETT